MRLGALIPIALIGAALVPAAAPAETRYLDAYDRSRDRYAGPVAMRTRLQRGVPYVLSARGTASFFATDAYAQGCGSFPEPRPVFRSPGRRNGLVGFDPEFIFAEPRQARRCRGDDPPFRVGVFQVSTFRAFRHPRLLGPVPTGPAANHAYRYALRGSNRRPRFRIDDPYARDNYGRFRLSVRRARPSQCAFLEFRKFGFRTEAACRRAATARRRAVPAS